MRVKNNVFIIPILFNIIVCTFLYLDFVIPSNNIDKEFFSSFYNIVNHYPKFKGSGGDEVLCVLECKSGKTYRIPSFPVCSEEELVGQKIEIEKTYFLGKAKRVNFIEINKQFNISFLSVYLIIILYLISIVVSLLNLFFDIEYLEIPLAFTFVFVFFTLVIYIFYF